MNQKNNDALDHLLIKLVQTRKPTNVQQLVDLTKSEATFIPKQEIIQHILQLKSQGKLRLQEPLIHGA